MPLVLQGEGTGLPRPLVQLPGVPVPVLWTTVALLDCTLVIWNTAMWPGSQATTMSPSDRPVVLLILMLAGLPPGSGMTLTSPLVDEWRSIASVPVTRSWLVGVPL